MLAGHSGDPAAALTLTTDPEAPVRAAAFGALARLGRWTPIHAAAALNDPDARVRRRACELTGRIAANLIDGPALATLLQAALDDEDPWVVESAAWALGELATTGSTEVSPPTFSSTTTTVTRLVTVAGNHPDPLCREAAVAALGAIGDPAGLDAVLDALSGKPPLRRRAAVALAGFTDPLADEALRRCLHDRDWQVREVAEELVGVADQEQDQDQD